MTDYKSLLGILAVIVGFIGYGPYLRDMLKGTTRPHPFSWIVWATLEAIVLVAQITSHAGAGAWVTGASMGVAVFVALYAIRKNQIRPHPTDIVALIGAFIGILLWRVTHSPLTAVVFVVLADMLGFYPTFRKSYLEPHGETLFEYGMSSLKWVIALFALQSFTVTNWLYPASLILTNSAFVIMSLVRRQSIPAPSHEKSVL